MKTEEKSLSKKDKQRLEYLFFLVEVSKNIINIWIFVLLQLGLLIVYISSGLPNILLLMISCSLLFLFLKVLEKKQKKIKKELLNRCLVIQNLISQELYNGSKLTLWQCELDFITSLLKQEKNLYKRNSLYKKLILYRNAIF